MYSRHWKINLYLSLLLFGMRHAWALGIWTETAFVIPISGASASVAYQRCPVRAQAGCYQWQIQRIHWRPPSHHQSWFVEYSIFIYFSASFPTLLPYVGRKRYLLIFLYVVIIIKSAFAQLYTVAFTYRRVGDGVWDSLGQCALCEHWCGRTARVPQRLCPCQLHWSNRFHERHAGTLHRVARCRLSSEKCQHFFNSVFKPRKLVCWFMRPDSSILYPYNCWESWMILKKLPSANFHEFQAEIKAYVGDNVMCDQCKHDDKTFFCGQVRSFR